MTVTALPSAFTLVARGEIKRANLSRNDEQLDEGAGSVSDVFGGSEVDATRR